MNFMAHLVLRASCTRKKCDKLRGEWVSHGKKECNSKNVVLYLHGGGFILCSPVTHRNILINISKYANCNVFALDYDTTPEKKYPTQLNQAMETYLGLIDMGYSPKNISIVGDSAGGNLALCLIDKLIQKNIPVPSSLVCISPWCDLSSSRPSIYRNRKVDPLLPANRVVEVARMYSVPKNLCSSDLSPVNKNSFRGYPPTMFQCGELEIMQDEMMETYDKMKDTIENECVYVEWEGAPHAFQLFAGLVPESNQSLEEIGKFISRNFSTSEKM